MGEGQRIAEKPEKLLYELIGDVCRFTRIGSGLTLRAYQQEVARSVVESVVNGRGLSFAVMFPRQSGKNEIQAQLEAYLLTLLSAAAMVLYYPKREEIIALDERLSSRSGR